MSANVFEGLEGDLPVEQRVSEHLAGPTLGDVLLDNAKSPLALETGQEIGRHGVGFERKLGQNPDLRADVRIEVHRGGEKTAHQRPYGQENGPPSRE